MTGQKTPLADEKQPMDPERYHVRNHRDGAEPFERCWRCGRARAVCRSKIRFASREEAAEWVDEFNEATRYANPLCRYRCRWCLGWHMTTAARKRHRARRAERERRKWLIRTRTETNSG